MGTLEASGKFFDGGILETLHLGKSGRIFHTADLDVAVTVEGESGLINLALLAAADIDIGAGGVTVVFQHSLPTFSPYSGRFG